MGLEDFDGILFDSVGFGEALIVIEIDKVSCSIVLSSLVAFRAVPSKVSHFSALETGIGRVCRGGCIALEVVLWLVSLVAVRVLSSSEVIASIVSSIVPSSRGPVPIDIHGDQSVIHPSWGVGRVILGRVLSLRTRIIPLRTLLLRGKSSEVPISSEYISEQDL